MKTVIALIGFMGAGKTAVGKALAQRLRKDFLELDTLIVEKAGKSIPEIFGQDGEIRFRELEIEVVKDVSARKNAVIACGGGVVLNRINIDRLRREGIVVYLVASPEAVLRRTAGDKGRPLLEVTDRTARIRELLAFRQPFYERAADITVDTSAMAVSDVVGAIIRQVSEDAGFPGAE